MYKYKAGTDIKAGQVVYLGKDGKAYPLLPKRPTLRQRLVATVRRLLRRPVRRDWPLGIVMADRGEGETLDVLVKGKLL